MITEATSTTGNPGIPPASPTGHQSAGFVEYLPLDMLNPLACSDSSLRTIAAEPECLSQVRAYIAGVLAGRVQARSACEQSAKMTELLEDLTWSANWELERAIGKMRQASNEARLWPVCGYTNENHSVAYTRLSTIIRIARGFPSLAVAALAAENELEFLFTRYR